MNRTSTRRGVIATGFGAVFAGCLTGSEPESEDDDEPDIRSHGNADGQDARRFECTSDTYSTEELAINQYRNGYDTLVDTFGYLGVHWVSDTEYEFLHHGIGGLMDRGRFRQAINGSRIAQNDALECQHELEDVLEFVDQCDPDEADLFELACENGFTTAETLYDSASAFETAAKVYVDDGADDLSHESQEALTELETALRKHRETDETWPLDPEELEERVLIYRGENE